MRKSESEWVLADPPLIPAASLADPGARRNTAEDIWFSPQEGRGNDGERRPQGRPSGPASPQPRIPALQFGQLARRHTRLDPVAPVPRAEDRGEVALDRALADVEIARDALVWLALRKHPQHFHSSTGKNFAQCVEISEERRVGKDSVRSCR